MGQLATVILAAGQGKRMKSTVPKVLHSVAGKPLIYFPIELARRLKSSRTVVVTGHGRDEVEQTVRHLAPHDPVRFVVQEQQLGTGHAVQVALGGLRGVKGSVLIISGDVPLLEKSSVTRLIKAYNKTGGKAAFLSFVPDDPAGYGRVIREGKHAVAIREHSDCTPAQRQITEVNSGIYLFDIAYLRKAVRKLSSDNVQGELYLTDVVEQAAVRHDVPALQTPADEVGGVNDRVDLARVGNILQKRINTGLMRAGVTMRDPETVLVDLGVKVGADTEIGPGAQLLGSTVVGRRCSIETGAIVSDSVLGAQVTVRAYSVLEKATMEQESEVGPMGRLRPGAVLKKNSKVGNFVELKNTVLGPGSKANHLAYLGDGDIGEGVNVGAGTIFCNYDGFMKHKTVLEDGVFIGSDSQLVAPVTVGAGAYVASGSTITNDVPSEALAIARARQQNKERVGGVLRKTLAARKKKALEEKEKRR